MTIEDERQKELQKVNNKYDCVIDMLNGATSTGLIVKYGVSLPSLMVKRVCRKANEGAYKSMDVFSLYALRKNKGSFIKEKRRYLNKLEIKEELD